MAGTLNPSLRSWVQSANATDCDFPVQNLPFGAFRRRSSNERVRIGVAIGDEILDVSACLAANLFIGASEAALSAAEMCGDATLNRLMSAGRVPARALRVAISALLSEDAGIALRQTAQHALVPQGDAELFLPARIGDYTDFYASVHHASNVGALFRPDSPLLPNYKWVPIGYHGRASSIVISDTPVRRPSGQRKGPNDEAPVFGPSRGLDYEVELGAFVGNGNALGEPIGIGDAEQHIFGLCLLNDWSARDVQNWEYQPLGPFLAKNFCSTVSPWVVTMDALEPYRGPLAPRASDDPQPLTYLTHSSDQQGGGFEITVELWLQTSAMRDAGEAPIRVSAGNSIDLYWTFAQMLAHHSSNGCNMQPGDLLGSGTISGPLAINRGCLLELTRRGAEPLLLPNGEKRAFLEDGDEVTLRAHARRDGAVRIGFGSCGGTVLPAL
ncbi:MAG: fumarylacetoacetase [Phycisphaerae bacterium]|nr:fumarylacetoacetase [Gemmatimonadaceae bacterium]